MEISAEYSSFYQKMSSAFLLIFGLLFPSQGSERAFESYRLATGINLKNIYSTDDENDKNELTAETLKFLPLALWKLLPRLTPIISCEVGAFALFLLFRAVPLEQDFLLSCFKNIF